LHHLVVQLERIGSTGSAWRWALGALCGLFLLANAPLLIGIDAINWDASTFFGPAWTLVADHARAGRFLLWNPFIEGGSPDSAQPELGAFSPIVVAMGAALGGTEFAFKLYWLAVWLVGGLGLLGLARHLRAPPWAGFVVALGYLFSGTFTGHAQHTSWLSAFASVPWVLWRLDVALVGRRVVPAAQAGALLGLAGLAGYPAIVIQTGVLAALWAAGRGVTAGAAERGERRRALGRAVGCVAVVALLAGLVLAPSWYAFLREAPGYSDRGGPLPRDVVVHDNSLHPGALATFASPYLHVLATLWAPTRWAPTDGSSAGLYTGVVIPVMAAFALCRNPRRRWLWWLVGVALFLLATSTGALPFRGWLYDLLPWERFSRHGVQRKDLALFIVSVIALHGVPGETDSDEPFSGGQRAGIWKTFFLCAAVVALVATATVIAGASFLGVPGPRPVFATAHFVVGWGGVAGLALLGWRGLGARPARRPLLPAALVALAILDAAGTVRLSRVLMVDRGRGREVWNRIGKERRSGIDLTDAGFRRVAASPDWTFPKPNNQNIPLRVPAFASYAPLTNPYRRATSDDPALAATAVGPERVWFAADALVSPPGAGALRELLSRSHDSGAAILIVHPPDAMAGTARPDVPSTAPVPSDGSAVPSSLRSAEATLHHHVTDGLEFSVKAPVPGWILLTDRWAAGWRVWVDGTERQVWGGNLIFRAVRVAAGPHRIRFVYRPGGYPHLLILSWGTLLVVTVMSAWNAFSDRGRSRTPTRVH
jgi:hypothetical protein